MDSIRNASAEDAEQIAEIYNHFVLNSTITFEEAAVSSGEMSRRIADIQTTPLPWLVAIRESRVAGFAYANRWKARAAYRHSVEITVYVRDGLGQSAVGTRLYEKLLAELKSAGIHAVIGGVALPNDASLRLHRKFGFEQVAHFREVGYKFGRWVDVTYWQLILNPPS